MEQTCAASPQEAAHSSERRIWHRRAAAEQIENAVPDLEQRVNQSNQQELELNMERNGTVQTMC